MKPWHENNRFWKNHIPFLFNPGRMKGAVQEVEQIVKLLSFAPPEKILDLGCGIGRHSLELARRGFQVIGVDRTQCFLEVAKKRAKQEGLSPLFLQDDMRCFSRPEFFDGAISMFTSFGYFSEKENFAVLRNIHRSLKRGGAVIMEMASQDVLRRTGQRQFWEEAGGMFLLEEVTPRENWKWLDHRRLLLKGGRKRELTFTHRFYSGKELKALLKKGGFAQIKLYGSLAGIPYNKKAQRLVATAVKG